MLPAKELGGHMALECSDLTHLSLFCTPFRNLECMIMWINQFMYRKWLFLKQTEIAP